jgi:Fic family protein
VDGNGRTARILLISEYFKNNYKPFILTSADKEKFNSLTKNNLSSGVKFLRELQSNYEKIIDEHCY